MIPVEVLYILLAGLAVGVSCLGLFVANLRSRVADTERRRAADQEASIDAYNKLDTRGVATAATMPLLEDFGIGDGKQKEFKIHTLGTPFSHQLLDAEGRCIQAVSVRYGARSVTLAFGTKPGQHEFRLRIVSRK